VHLLQNVEAKQGHAESQQRPRILLQTPACPEETEPIAVYNMNMAGYPNEQRQSRSSLLNKRHIPSCFYPIAPCRAIGGSLADQSSLLLWSDPVVSVSACCAQPARLCTKPCMILVAH